MRKMKRMIAWVLACVLFLTTGGNHIFAAALEETDRLEMPLINYVSIDQPLLTAPGTQMVMIGIGDGSIKIDTAVLSYKNQETGETYQAATENILDDFAAFQMDFAKESKTGTYQLESLSYTAEGIENEVSFEEIGIHAAFGVNQAAETEPDDVFLSEEDVEALAAETEMNIVSLDSEGNPVDGGTIEEAMESAGCDTVNEGLSVLKKGAGNSGVDATGMSSLVVVLDPGHGGSDPGTQANGIVEKTVNLKIAQYCQAELEEYAGVTVYMTRKDDTYLSLAQRAQVAINKRANVFVSLHNNANTSPIPNGASVYYPNSSYNANCGATGQALASVILSKLTALGLASKGILIRNSENGTKYPDGSLADYYGVIKRCKENGIPALIVEHAFVTNATDVKNHLSTDAQLKALGVADATGIAEYYGLKKGLGFNSVQSKSSTTMELKWTPVIGVTGYCIYRSTSSGDGFEEIVRVKPATITTWEDTGLAPGETYYYKIRTYTETDSKVKYGKYSTTVSASTMSSPKISSIKSKNSKALVISWVTINNAANYEIYRSTKKNGTYEKIATITGINRVSYTDTKVKAGKKYFYKIRSIGQVDNTTIYSDYSVPVPARTAKIPTDIAVKSWATDTLRVSWTPDINASGYVVKRAESANGKYTKVGTVNGGTVKYFDDNTVSPYKTYYYKVQTFNHNGSTKGYSGFSTSAYGKTIKKTSFTKIVTNSSTSQTISWKKASGINGYVIYQSNTKNGKYKKIKTITSANTTSYKVTGLTAGTGYYYKVRTRKKENGKTEYGSYTKPRQAFTKAKAVVTSVQGVTGNSVQVFWNPVSGADHYDVYRAPQAQGTYTKLASLPSTEVSYIDKNLDMTAAYYYKIEAFVKGYKSVVSGGMSNVLSGLPVSSTLITSATENANGFVELAWAPVKDIKGYQIYRSTQADSGFTLISTISDAASVRFVDTSAVRGMQYYYKIALFNEYNNKMVYGSQSAAVSITLSAAP